MSKDQGTHQSQKKWDWIQLISIILLLTGTFVLTRFLSSLQMTFETSTTPEKLEMVVETEKVKPQSRRLFFSTTGTVQARALTNIVPRVSGRIVAIDNSAFAGGIFTSDTLLFRIDKEDYELALAQAQSEITQAQTQLRLQEAKSATAAAEWRELHPGEPVPPLVTRMNRVFLGFKEPDTDLVPEVFVSVKITGPVRENVWLLPLDALQQDGHIWVVTPEKKLRLLKLSIIQITTEKVVAQSNGSTIAVVRGSLPEATDGTPVRISEKKEKE